MKTSRGGTPNTSIRYTTADSILGPLLVAATDQGVCAIELGESAEVLIDSLRQRFDRADIKHDREGLQDYVDQVLALIEKPQSGHRLPLDLHGTALQMRVWRAMCKTKPGEIVSYTELARRVGRPDAVRAVAGAVAANHLALVVPCHRIIGRDGTMHGYRWGVALKEILLQAEGSMPALKKAAKRSGPRHSQSAKTPELDLRIPTEKIER